MRGGGYLRAAILLVLSMGAGGFAMGENYTVLMNPAFRWVTLVGSGLLFLMATSLFWKPDRGWSAVLIFGGFLALVVWTKPQAGGTTPMLVPPEAAALSREGYPPMPARELFENLDTEASGLTDGPRAMRGFVKRTPELDAEGVFILLEPMMACCLADAVALGLRVKTADGVIPEDLEWVHVFGTLRALPEPKELPPFRVGAILLTSVSRTHRLEADEIVSFKALLDPLHERIPEKRASFFRAAFLASGLNDEMDPNGTYTLFVPIDSAFRDLTEADKEALLADRERLRAFVGSHILPQELYKSDLYRNEDLPTLAGTPLRFQAKHGKLTIGGARFLFGDQSARNGVMHFVHRRLDRR